MSNSDEIQNKNTPQENINEPYLTGLCNCGCGGSLAHNGGILNQDGTRRKYIKYHHLNDRANFKPPKKRTTTKKSSKKESKQIRELKRTVDSLMTIVQDAITPPKDPAAYTPYTIKQEQIKSPPFESRPVIKQQQSGGGKPRIPEDRRCVYCKSNTTYAGPKDEKPKWYLVDRSNPDAGHMCNTCNNIKYRLSKRELRTIGLTNIIEEEKKQPTAAVTTPIKPDSSLNTFIESSTQTSSQQQQQPPTGQKLPSQYPYYQSAIRDNPKNPQNILYDTMIDVLKRHGKSMYVEDMAKTACIMHEDLKYYLTEGLSPSKDMYMIGDCKKLRVVYTKLVEHPNIKIVGIKPVALLWVDNNNTDQASNNIKNDDEIDKLKQELDLRNKDVKTLENEITDTVNRTRTMLQNKDDIIKAQSDSFMKLEEEYRKIDNEFGIKYRQWEELTNRVSELEVLNQNMQNKLDRKTQDAKSATDTLVYHLNKVINLETKLRVLQKEKEAWVKLCNEANEKKDKENKENKPVVPLTFKPIE